MKKLLLAFVALAAVSLILTGCPATATATPVEATATFTILNGDEPTSIDPAHITGVLEHRIFMAIFEGLTINDPKTLRALPGLAESWTSNADYTVWTFKLRKTNWTDDTPIDAKTVVGSFERTLNPNTAAEYAYMINDFVKGASEYNAGTLKDWNQVGIKALDDYTVEIALNGPTPFYPDVVAHYAYAVMPLHAIAKYKEDWTKMENFVGNGAFTLKEWTQKDRLIVEKSPKYWDAANVAIKTIVFLPIVDNNSAYEMFKEGKADWCSNIPNERIDEIKLTPNYQVAPEYATYYYIFNCTKKPFDDVRVRKALAMSINKKDLVEKVTKGGQIAADAFVLSSVGYTSTKGNGYDVAAAKALLAEAGFPDGKGFPATTVLYNTNDNHKKIAEFIQQQWKDNLGISVSLINQEWKVFLETRQQLHDFQISRAGWIAGFLDPATFLYMFRSSNTAMNDGLYNNPRYDELLNKAQVASGDERMKYLMEAEKIFIDEDQGLIPLYFYVTQDLVDQTKWEGWTKNPMNVHNWKFIKPKAGK